MTAKRRACLGSMLLALAWMVPAQAAVRPSGAEPAMVTRGRAPRLHREVTWRRDGAGLWTAIDDHDTGVPLRLWGPGQPAPGTVNDPAAAEAWARGFLAAHLDVLAPGAAASDFVVVANQLDPSGELRSVGFAQHAGGVAVRGGAISFAFKRDRMIMVGSTALPHVAIAAPRALRLAAPRVRAAAVAWLGEAGRRVAPRAQAAALAATQIIVPIVHPRATGPIDITYTLAEQISVEAIDGTPGRWDVFVDAATGAAFARVSTLMFATGSVLFDVPDRAPRAAAGRHPQPAGDAIHTVNGVAVRAGPDGKVTWDGVDPARVLPGLSGPFVEVINHAGPLSTGNLALRDAESCTWSRPADEVVDAQLDAFIYANQVKRFAKLRIDPGLAYLDAQLEVNVNEAIGTCNAFSTGDDLHFYPLTAGRCENTGRMADVVYHEFGHSLHHHAIIRGVGEFNASMSEGVADTLAAAMVNDAGIGRGFYFDDRPLRDLDPAQKKVWPRDANGEVHDEGEIYGEAMWDLRRRLEASLGVEPGFARFLQIYYGTVQRAVDIPSCFAEALVADDDDGDLANGTPNDCDIITAFTAHGLFDPSITGGVPVPVRDSYTVTVTGAPPAAATCHTPSVASATLRWRPRGGTLATLPLAADGAAFRATIPTQPDGTIVEYSVEVTLSNGAIQAFPHNAPDPLYQFQVGTPIPIWCADFENGAAGWTHSAMPASQDRWEAGAPSGVGGAPKAAHSGTQVFGTALTRGGRYLPVTSSLAMSPGIDLQGHVNVHLQYYRWLGVEDGYYDQASITANDALVWRNYASPTDTKTAEVNHIDQEWRFQDIDLSTRTASGNIRLTFALTSDLAFEASGWNLDDVCLVAWAPVCGNFLREAGERCDDGNAASGDGCSSVCQPEAVEPTASEAGCCSAGGGPAAPAGLAAIVLGLVIRRRRRRR